MTVPAVIRKPWTKQPPQGTKIDWSNPLTRELVFFAPDGNLGVDVVGGLRMSPGPSAPVLHHVAFTAHPYMDGYAFDNTAGTRDGFHSTDLSDAILNKEGASGWTSMCFASINSFVDFHQIFGIREDTSPWYQCSLTRHNSTAADIQMTVQGSGGNDLVNAGAACDNFLPSGQTADLAQLVVTHQNTGSATRFTSYKNGVLFGTQTSGSGRDIDFAGLTTPSVSIGAWDETADRGIMIGTACAMWARELSAAEVSALYSNPWQVFKPKTFYVGATEKRKLVMF
jgi:hypothetical protein